MYVGHHLKAGRGVTSYLLPSGSSGSPGSLSALPDSFPTPSWLLPGNHLCSRLLPAPRTLPARSGEQDMSRSECPDSGAIRLGKSAAGGVLREERAKRITNFEDVSRARSAERLASDVPTLERVTSARSASPTLKMSQEREAPSDFGENANRLGRE
jgi:hypothetical protein